MPPTTQPRRRVPGWLRALAALVGVALLWSAGWLLAAHEAGVALQAWVEAEALRGRDWTCPSQQLSGFPVDIDVGCDRPTFRGEIAGHIATGSVERLRATVGLDHPDTLDVGLTGPLYLRAQDESFDLVVSWTALNLAIHGLAGRPGAASLDAARLAVTLATPDRANVNLRAVRLSGSAAAVDAAPQDAAFDFAAAGVSFPTLVSLPGLDAPTDASGRGVLVGASHLQAPTAAQLDAWRGAGGMLTVSAFAMKMGSFAGEASGTLRLDDAHRPAGRLDASLTGFEPIAKRLGIPLAGVQLGGLLTSLLGGKGAPAEPGAINLPLTLEDGRLSVGPFDTGTRLDPLY